MTLPRTIILTDENWQMLMLTSKEKGTSNKKKSRSHKNGGHSKLKNKDIDGLHQYQPTFSMS